MRALVMRLFQYCVAISRHDIKHSHQERYDLSECFLVTNLLLISIIKRLTLL